MADVGKVLLFFVCIVFCAVAGVALASGILYLIAQGLMN